MHDFLIPAVIQVLFFLIVDILFNRKTVGEYSYVGIEKVTAYCVNIIITEDIVPRFVTEI